ncbi:MAG: DUF5677 domain-containing protein [Firmicutes bacterium]|nr:DUF5677 domain-containing protein [Bacillota bacterium]MCM1393290.1 DUF5677 domain-containing protein [[Eubacterium] siraeum]
MIDYNSPEAFAEYKKTLKRLFSKEINGSFLMEIFYKVSARFGKDIDKYYNLQIPDDKQIIVGEYENFAYDFCRHIIGIHRSNLIAVSEQEQKRIENDGAYKENLVNQVIENVKLRQYGSTFFRKKAIISGERFLYYPVPYDLFVINTKMNELLMRHSQYLKNTIFYDLFVSIANKGMACFTLLENNLLNDVYPLLRGMVEVYIKLLLLCYTDGVSDTYATFTNLNEQKSRADFETEKPKNAVFPPEFEKLYENRTNKLCKSKADYLHFGWLDCIADYHSDKPRPYSVNGIISYLGKHWSKDKTFLSDLKTCYKMCHSYVHGNTPYYKHQLLKFYEICVTMTLTISNAFCILRDTFKADTKINGIDILDKLDNDFIRMQKQFANDAAPNNL